MYDVAVVGYGPVGAVAASLLARAGLRVAVCDQFREIFDKPRAIGGDHEMMRAMQVCGIAEAMSRITLPFAGSIYLGVDGQPIRRFVPPEAPYPQGWPQGMMYIQPEIEALLRDAIAACPNVDVFLEHRLVEFTAAPRSVSLSLLDLPSGETRVIEAQWVLACDGANSVIRKQLDIGLDDLNFDETWAVVDTWLRRPDAVPQTNIQYCWPSRPATFVVGPRDLRRWELKLLPGETAADFEAPEKLAKALEPYVDPTAIEIWRVAVYRFHATVAAAWRSGRIFLVGDAAHQMPPFLGQGLCSGVRDAFNLAWKLVMVMRERAEETLLDSYQEERLPHTSALVELAKQAGLVIGEMDLAAARRRDAAMAELLTRGASEMRRQNMIPPLVGGLIGRDAQDMPAPGAGTQSPQPWVTGEDGRCLLLDEACGLEFMLLTSDAESQTWLTESLTEFWRRIEGVRAVITDATTEIPTPGHGVLRLRETGRVFTDALRALDCVVLVVRPDRHIYGGARTQADLIWLVENLRRQLFPSQSARGIA